MASSLDNDSGPPVPTTFPTDRKPGQAWQPDIFAPDGGGFSVSALPVVGQGPAPANATGRNDQHKLGIGWANPTVHGGD